jgi:hypothetical protein
LSHLYYSSAIHNIAGYHVRCNTKAMVHTCKVNTKEELHQRSLSTARSTHNTAVLCSYTFPGYMDLKTYPGQWRALQITCTE